MCLAVPMKIINIFDDNSGEVEADGIVCRVDLSLIEEAEVNDYVIVHAGFGIEKLDTSEADERIKLFNNLAESQNEKESK